MAKGSRAAPRSILVAEASLEVDPRTLRLLVGVVEVRSMAADLPGQAVAAHRMEAAVVEGVALQAAARTSKECSVPDSRPSAGMP